MKNTQLETRYRAGENLLWVDNDNRLYMQLQNTQKAFTEYRKSIWNAEKLYRFQNWR